MALFDFQKKKHKILKFHKDCLFPKKKFRTEKIYTIFNFIILFFFCFVKKWKNIHQGIGTEFYKDDETWLSLPNKSKGKQKAKVCKKKQEIISWNLHYSKDVKNWLGAWLGKSWQCWWLRPSLGKTFFVCLQSHHFDM